MKLSIVRLVSLASFSALLALIGCSSDDNSSASACDEAAKVSDSCSTSAGDGGSSITVKFDAAKCKQTDQGKKAAQCIVDNKSKCDCVLKCSLAGSCS